MQAFRSHGLILPDRPGFGTARFLKDRDAKAAALDVLMKHYGGSVYPVADRMLETIAVIRVDIESISGKTRYDSVRKT